MNAHKIIAAITGLLTLTLAIFSFILSFNSLTDLARQHGVSIPALFPFVVEFAVVIFSLNALYRSLVGEPTRWQWSLIILSSLLAGAFNVAHATPDWLSRTIGGMPSLFLLLSFESFLSLLKYNVQQTAALTNLSELTRQGQERQTELDNLNQTLGDKTAQLSRLQDKIHSLTDQLRGLEQQVKLAEVGTTAGSDLDQAVSASHPVSLLDKANQAKTAKVAQRQASVLALLQEGLSPMDISRQLQVSVKTIKRDLNSLNGQASQH